MADAVEVTWQSYRSTREVVAKRSLLESVQRCRGLSK